MTHPSDSDKNTIKTVDIDRLLELFYNSAWIEGSNWRENNPEHTPIPSEREVKKTAHAKQHLLNYFLALVGEDEDAHFEQNVTYIEGNKGMILDEWGNFGASFRNDLRDELRDKIRSLM